MRASKRSNDIVKNSILAKQYGGGAKLQHSNVSRKSMSKNTSRPPMIASGIRKYSNAKQMVITPLNSTRRIHIKTDPSVGAASNGPPTG